MDNRATVQPLNGARATQTNNTNTRNRNNATNANTTDALSADWKSYFTPEKLKLFHTIVLILFLILLMSYIFNTKSNVLRVIIILSLSAFLLCESFVIYSYKWSM